MKEIKKKKSNQVQEKIKWAVDEKRRKQEAENRARGRQKERLNAKPFSDKEI